MPYESPAPAEISFDVPIHGVINFFGRDLWVTNTLVTMWVVMAIMLVFAIIVRIKLKSFKERPTGFQNVIEMMVEFFDRFVKNNSNHRVNWLGGWFFTLFTFLIISNIFGIFPGQRPPTADWPLPLTLALTTFFLIQFSGIRYQGMKYIRRTYLGPHWVFLPINLLGELARPVSLSFRLFGNILGGVILISLIYQLAPTALLFFVPVPLHLIFDLAFGGLQAFIFTILSLTYVGLAAAD